MLRRRIRKTETAWRKLCRFPFLLTQSDRGTRTASACSLLTGGAFFAEPQQGDSPSADGGNVAAPAAGAKRKGHLRFPFLFELLPFPCFLIWRRLPTCDRFETGVQQKIFSSVSFETCSQGQITFCYTCGLVSAGATYPCCATLWHVVTHGTYELSIWYNLSS